MDQIETLFAIVALDHEGNEELLYATVEDKVVPLVTSSLKVAGQFYELGRIKAMESGDRLKIIQFDKFKELLIGDPQGEEFRTPDQT